MRKRGSNQNFTIGQLLIDYIKTNENASLLDVNKPQI